MNFQSEFTYIGLPQRVLFGAGRISSLSDEIDALGCKRALVLSTPEQVDSAESIARDIGARAAGVYSGATMHTPTHVSENAVAAARACDADCLVAVGGGSTIGLGKAIALRTDLPQIAIPTTYAGSEMTPILGETSDGRKTTQRSLKVLPETVIYDVELTLGLPTDVSGVSGLNAIAHAVEGLYARDRNPICSLMAEDAVRALAGALPRIAANPNDVAARTDALYGAWLCGMVLGAVGMALHHKLCHTLGGAFDLPHAQTHAVVLPYALAYNRDVVPVAMQALGRALGVRDPVAGLQELARTLGAPKGLRDLGMPEAGIARAAELAVANPYWNPRPIEREPIEHLLRRAWNGSEAS